MPYQHFALEEGGLPGRIWGKRAGYPGGRANAKRPPSAASRGVGRNRGKRGYHPYGAYSKATHRGRIPHRWLKGVEGGKLEYVMKALGEWHWSPGQVAGDGGRKIQAAY